MALEEIKWKEMTIKWNWDGNRGDKTKSSDNEWSEIETALQEIKWKAMTMHESK